MNCYDAERIIEPFDLLIAEETEFDLTGDRVYVARSHGYGGTVKIVDDKGVEETYAIEYFRFYNGETIGF